MHPEFYIVCFLIILFLIWNITLVNVDNIDGVVVRGHTANNVIEQYAIINDIGPQKVVLYKHTGRFKSVSTQTILSGGRWSIGARPIVGDHIHAAISFWVGGQLRDVEHDRNPIQHVQYEVNKPASCKTPGTEAYTKVWPHAGVHTHCDGLIHIHPWSAPSVIRKEGIDVQLQLWFDQVGIQYRELPYVSLQFQDGLRLDGNRTHRWYVAEKKCFKDSKATIYNKHFNQIWLGHAYASYVVWFGRLNSEAPPQVESHLVTLSAWGAKGYNQQPYPHTCL